MTIISMKQTFRNPTLPSLSLSVNRNTKNTLFLQRRRANEKKEGRAIFYINSLPSLFHKSRRKSAVWLNFSRRGQRTIISREGISTVQGPRVSPLSICSYINCHFASLIQWSFPPPPSSFNLLLKTCAIPSSFDEGNTRKITKIDK